MIAEELANFIVNLDIGDIPQEVIKKAKLHMLDTIGIMIAVNNFKEIKPLIELIKEQGGSQESTIIGNKIKVPMLNAVLANGVMAHSVDYDDTHLGSGIHVSSTAVVTALAVGEKIGADGKLLISSIVGGYEIGSRLGKAAPWKFHARGFHPTSVVGVFISTAVASKLLGLKEDEIVNAFGIAGSFSSGILQSLDEGVWVKPFHPAWASHAGIFATLLAKKGYKGPRGVFEGRLGLFNTFLHGENIDYSEITKDLGKKWETLNIAIKPYPSCHATHSTIDAMIYAKNTYAVKPEDVEEIILYSPKISFDLGLFNEEKVVPKTTYAAKFSAYYTAARALERGYVGIWDFTENSITHANTLKLTKKIKGIYEKELDKYAGENVVPVKANIKIKNGSSYEILIINHKGTPNNPMSDDDIIFKFKDNINNSIYKDNSREIMKIVLSLEKHKIEELINLIN